MFLAKIKPEKRETEPRITLYDTSKCKISKKIESAEENKFGKVSYTIYWWK